MAWVAVYIPRWFAHPKTIIHPSTNRARCKVTSLSAIKTLPPSQTDTPSHYGWILAILEKNKEKFYRSLNNILNVIGYTRNEMVAVHLVTAYCLPALLYGCESWSLRHELQEFIRRWDSERELIYDDVVHAEVSAYAHWTDCLISKYRTFEYQLHYIKLAYRYNSQAEPA